MTPTPTDVYLAGFVARCRARTEEGTRELVLHDGLYGLLPNADDPRVRVVVVDDRACDVVASVLEQPATTGAVSVFAAATACTALLAGTPGWEADTATAMAFTDLAALREPPLPGVLRVRPVRRLESDDADGVALLDAVALTDPGPTPDHVARAGLADHLRTMPASTRLLAAVDREGIARATSGYGVFDDHAHVIFVNTDPAWQGRGIGTAMTALALLAARDGGARDAYLDASDEGLGLYRRMGFVTASAVTRFRRTG